ncbi:MAG: HDOD domain-containing protein [Spirochaetia bacterium]
MASIIDIAEIQKAALRSIPLTFKLTSLPHESHALLDRILEAYLVELGQERILEPLSYCLKELIINAQKANTKRLYFEEKGLDISSEADYDEGMRDFREQSSARIEHWLELLKQRGQYIGITFHARSGSLSISVRNGAELTAREQERIYDRIARARAFHSFVEALAQPIDTTEGAGLGIMILLQFLKRIGLGEEAFVIEARNGETVAALTIPMNQVQLEKISVLTEAIVRDVEALPHFPDTILELIHITEDPRATLAQIAGRIATDPALTADLLKLVNSAHYVLPRRVNNILQGVKIAGMKGLRNLLFQYGAQKILGEKYAEMKELWEHSYRTAFYSFMLARSFKPKADILDDVYVAGILHDLGQIIVTYLHPQAMEQMARFCRDKDIPPRILERFSFGLNHADIGALIARKWNFPEQLVHGIKHHHEPLVTPLQHKDVVYCVYLGNAFCGLERDLITFEQIERPVLSDFGIGTEEQGRSILARLKNAFERRTAAF